MNVFMVWVLEYGMLVLKEMQRDTLSFYENSPLNRPLSIISIPTDLGSDARGCSDTPAYLYKHGLERMLEYLEIEVANKTTVACPTAPPPSMGRLKNLKEVADVARKSAMAVEAAAKRGEVVLALGGDHSSAIGTIAGASQAHRSLGVIWIDAHPDAHTDQTTATHNLHDMGAALAMGIGHDDLLGERRAINPDNFLYIGLKDFDQAEIELLREHNNPVTMLDIAAHGLAPALAAIEALAANVEHVWISMDIDSIDKQYAPGVAMPCEDGLTRREILTLAQYIGRTCNVAGLDIVEMLPTNDKDDMTAKLAIELTARFLGGEYSWYRDYMDNYEKLNSVQEKSFDARP